MKLIKLIPIAALSVVLGASFAAAAPKSANMTKSTTHQAKGVNPLARGTSGFAVVNADGSFARGANSTGSFQISGFTGAYEVDMNSNVSKCNFTATTGGSGTSGTTPDAIVTVAGRNGNANAVFVATFDATGAAANAGFHLNVRC